MLAIALDFLWGMLVGFIGLIPGVGIQITAVIIGIYDEILHFLFMVTEAVKAGFYYFTGKQTKADVIIALQNVPWRVGIPMVSGILIPALLFSTEITQVYTDHPLFFEVAAFAIVAASLVVPLREMPRKSWKEALVFLVTAGPLLLLYQVPSLVNDLFPSSWLYFIGGLFGSLAELVPKIAMIHVLTPLGIYDSLHNAIEVAQARSVDLYSFTALLLFIFGGIIGGFIWIRGIEFFSKRSKSLFLAFICGLIVAALPDVWPFTNAHGTPIAMWQLTLTPFTQQIISLVVTICSIILMRLFAEKREELSTSFWKKERVKITS